MNILSIWLNMMINNDITSIIEWVVILFIEERSVFSFLDLGYFLLNKHFVSDHYPFNDLSHLWIRLFKHGFIECCTNKLLINSDVPHEQIN